jgi:hypothetical protein
VTKNSFAPKQRWVKTPKRRKYGQASFTGHIPKLTVLVVFIDETKEVAKDANEQGLEDADYDDGSPGVVESTDGQHQQSRHRRSVENSQDAGNQDTPGSPTDRFILREEAVLIHHNPTYHAPNVDQIRSPSEPRPQIYLSEPVWPLTNASEARLFRHFVQKLAIWVSSQIGLPLGKARMSMLTERRSWTSVIHADPLRQ